MSAVHALGRRARRATAIVGFVLAGALALGAPATSFADAAAPASCMGHEASSISPPGSSAEFPGGMPALKRFISDNFAGVPAGAIYSTIARLHEGSHAACDEALE